MTENRYWNRTGAAQAKYDEMEAAGWDYTKTTLDHMHRYYRYYNDGDAPSRIRFLVGLLYPYHHENPEVHAYEEKLEAKATERIETEYRRFRQAVAAGRF